MQTRYFRAPVFAAHCTNVSDADAAPPTTFIDGDAAAAAPGSGITLAGEGDGLPQFHFHTASGPASGPNDRRLQPGNDRPTMVPGAVQYAVH